MPVLALKTVKVELPSYPGSEVVMYEKAPFGAIADVKDGMGNIDIAKNVLPRIILEWNLTDEKGNTLPINIETLLKLPLDDVNFLLESALEHIKGTLKKKTSGE